MDIKTNGQNGNMLDKLIGYFSPSWGMQRSRTRFFASIADTAYTGASLTSRKLKNWYPSLGSADANYSQGEQQTLTARCRDAYRNQPLARAALDRLKHNVVGVGLRCQSQVDAISLGISRDAKLQLERFLEGQFDLWLKDCDYEETLNFYEMQALCLISQLISGDIFVNTIYDKFGNLKLQAIEADLVCNPSFSMDTKTLRRGVELDERGRPVAYHVMTAHPYDVAPTAYEWVRVPAVGQYSGRKIILHLFEKERPGQTRGIPYLATVLEPLRLLDRYTDAELTAAVVAGYFTAFIKTEASLGMQAYTESTSEPSKDDQVALGPGAMYSLSPGESIEAANPGRPNTAYESFVSAVQKQIGGSLSLPIEFIQLYFSASYSASRAAMLQAWKTILYHRRMLVDQFCQPVYEQFVDSLVARGKLNINNYNTPEIKHALTKAKWLGAAKGAIDEENEIAAAKERITLGISTLQIEAEELVGADWLEILEQRALEEKVKREYGIISEGDQINEQAANGPSMGYSPASVERTSGN